jgi:cation transport ATPase
MQVTGNNAPVLSTLEIPIQGMDCADCTRHVQRAIASLPGVDSVEVYLTTEKAVIRHRPGELELSTIRKAVSQAGYSVPDQPSAPSTQTPENPFSRQVLTLLGVVFGLVLFVVIIGEGLGFIQALTERVPLSLA